MRRIHLIPYLLFVSIALTLSSPAVAKPGKGKGHGPKGQSHAPAAQGSASVEVEIRIGSEARAAVKDYYRSHRGCPPGLAKKRNGCQPPGQAKKRYHVGGVLPPHLRDHRPPPDLHRRLPPPPEGHIYRHVDGDVLLVAEATHRVVDAVVAVDAAMNALED